MTDINGKDYIYQHKYEFQTIIGSDGEVDCGVKQLDCTGAFAGNIKDKFKHMSIIERVIYMARNEDNDGTTYNLAAQKLLNDAGIKGKR